jgi:hypothetical protein
MNSHAHPHPDTRVYARGPSEHQPYAPPRRHWPGVLAALAVAAVVALLAVNNTDRKDTLPAPPLITEPTAAGPSQTSPTSEQTTDRTVEDTSGVIVTDEQPVDVSTPPVEDRAPAQ